MIYRIHHKHMTNLKTPSQHLFYVDVINVCSLCHNTYERWLLTFETNLQLTLLFIFLKLLTFSGATFCSRFQCQGILNLLFFLFFLFLIPYVTGLFCCLSLFCGHKHLFNDFLIPFIYTMNIDSVCINWYQVEMEIYSYTSLLPNFDLLVQKTCRYFSTALIEIRKLLLLINN